MTAKNSTRRAVVPAANRVVLLARTAQMIHLHRLAVLRFARNGLRMLDKLTEEGLLSITEAVACFAGWPAASTVRRWARDGIRGHKLDAVVIGHRLFTSRPAIERFIAATTAAAGISKP